MSRDFEALASTHDAYTDECIERMQAAGVDVYRTGFECLAGANHGHTQPQRWNDPTSIYVRTATDFLAQFDGVGICCDPKRHSRDFYVGAYEFFRAVELSQLGVQTVYLSHWDDCERAVFVDHRLCDLVERVYIFGSTKKREIVPWVQRCAAQLCPRAEIRYRAGSNGSDDPAVMIPAEKAKHPMHKLFRPWLDNPLSIWARAGEYRWN